MDLVRLRPSLLAARGPRCGLAAASPARSVAAAHPLGLPSLHLRAITFYHLYVLSIEMVKGQFLCPAKGPKVLPSINVRNSLVGNPPTTGYHIDQQLALSIVSVSLLAVENLSDVSPLFLTGLLEAVVAALFMNIYIVGLNQLAALCVLAVRAVIVQLAFFLHIQASLQRPAVFTMPLIFATAFMTFFSVVIALFKLFF
uniref:Uncharacterized protein n=1 Tax=Oryza meridionalis TaxID=40149 RepID=A0A0E0E4N8_9ORYZ